MHSALTNHIDKVIAVGTGGDRSGAPDAVFLRSWARCIKQYGLDPARPTPARILPEAQVRQHQQRMDSFLQVARSGMEELYRRVADLGYMVLLTDADGITVDYIGNPSTEPQLKAAGLYLGADWSEAHAGTCGVGTALIEGVAITCHQAEHFDATHIALTCSSAPLFTPEGSLLGVLDVSALHSPEARESQHLARHLALMHAQMIEDANFLRSFGRHWVLRLGRACGLVEVSGEVMFAFDEDGLVVGANTGARRRFGSPDGASLIGRSLMDFLDLSFDGLWSLARGRVATEVSGRYPYHDERFYPAVIAPRLRAASASRVTSARPPLSHTPSRGSALDRLAGGDAAMQRLIGQAKRLVDNKVSLLIHGETGSGKEVLARALHDHSSRSQQPFIAVNCASIPESLIESELFGYTPGSFTGGKSKGMKGLIAQSDGGTLFLDEIGDMPLHLQTRFLRVLSESEVLPLGAEKPVAVNLNVIAATHRDLKGSIEHGSFREDLYYRLSGATLQLPPLRERRDIEYLIQTVFDEESRRLGTSACLTSEAVDRLVAHPWPGNIRELRNALRFALALAGDGPVSPAELPAQIGMGIASATMPSVTVDVAADVCASVDADSDRLLRALRKHKWSITATAHDLGMCRATVYRQMKRYGITSPNRL